MNNDSHHVPWVNGLIKNASHLCMSGHFSATILKSYAFSEFFEGKVAWYENVFIPLHLWNAKEPYRRTRITSGISSIRLAMQRPAKCSKSLICWRHRNESMWNSSSISATRFLNFVQSMAAIYSVCSSSLTMETWWCFSMDFRRSRKRHQRRKSKRQYN